MPRLTKRFVEGLIADGRDHDYFDDALKGFGLRVRRSGQKSYFVMTRLKGCQRRYTIGPHGPVTTEVAKRKAKEILADVAAGRAPKKDRDNGPPAPTIGDLGIRFLKEYAAVHLKPSTQAEYRRSIELFICPRIGKLSVADVERQHIAQLHHDLRHIPYQANRTLGVVSKMFNMAEVWNLRPDNSNPCRHIRKYAEHKRQRFLREEEYARLGAALRAAAADGTETTSAIDAIWLLMLTGCRLGEILTLRWEHVDIEARELRLADSKTGQKVVHLGTAAIERLRLIRRAPDNPFVIAGRKPFSRLTDLQHPWRRVRAAAGLQDVRLHDLRHSYASGALALGEGLPMIGKLLGHTQVQTTAGYAHLASDPVKIAADRVATRIANASG